LKRKTGRYSGYIRPFSYALDLLTINVLALLMLSDHLNTFWYHIFISISWIFIAWNIDFYEVYRYTKVIRITGRVFKQYIAFLVLNFAYIGFFLKFSKPSEIVWYVTLSVAVVAGCKFFVYFFLRKYRVVFGGNFRRVIIIGHGKSTDQLASFFNDNPDYGYKLIEVFSLKNNKKQELQDSLDFVVNHAIDEVYCSLSNVNNSEITDLIDFADNNLKILKFLPDNKTPLSRNLIYDYYDYIPILSLRNVPLDKRANKAIKRAFDIVFSILVIVGVLSWLTPILAILIKSESKGNVFFKQIRNGLNNKEFYCYKFRSMKPNEIADLHQVTKNDPRITKVGAFLRKTSLDELPQFWNVLKGDMSVVGPRPHMVAETERFVQKVDKFMVRHFIKPGITGLAQTNGYRGEVETDKDIINRVKYDIFYLENWSFLLDLKIVTLTVYNAIRGDKKAY
jgi:putative colanic acid biosynthesis UDP-glucose lipid carrier transferase